MATLPMGSIRHLLATFPFRFTCLVHPCARIVNDARYLIVPCEAEGCADLAVIWDRLEEQVVDVIDAAAGRYTDEDALWDEFKAETFRPAQPSRQWRAAA